MGNLAQFCCPDGVARICYSSFMNVLRRRWVNLANFQKLLQSHFEIKQPDGGYHFTVKCQSPARSLLMNSSPKSHGSAGSRGLPRWQSKSRSRGPHKTRCNEYGNRRSKRLKVYYHGKIDKTRQSISAASDTRLVIDVHLFCFLPQRHIVGQVN